MSTSHTKKYNGIIKKRAALPAVEVVRRYIAQEYLHAEPYNFFSDCSRKYVSDFVSACVRRFFLGDFVSGLCVLFFSDFVSDDTDSGEEAKDECSENCNGKHIHERHTGS